LTESLHEVVDTYKEVTILREAQFRSQEEAPQMVTSTSLRDMIEAHVSEIESLVRGIDEAKASARAADSDWSVREILSHLAGPPGVGEELARTKTFVSEDNPTVNVVPGVSHYDSAREDSTVQELLAEFAAEYRGIGDWLATLSDEQLDRKANIPFLKDTPLDESQSLREWAGIVANLHLKGHVEQIREACAR
jgi:hypothetical protein